MWSAYLKVGQTIRSRFPLDSCTGRSSMAQWKTAQVKIEGRWFKPHQMHYNVSLSKTLYRLHWFNLGNIPIWLKNCWLVRKASIQKLLHRHAYNSDLPYAIISNISCAIPGKFMFVECKTNMYYGNSEERSCSVCRVLDFGSKVNGARHFILCLVLVPLRKIGKHPD